MLALIDYRFQQLIDITIAVNSDKKHTSNLEMVPVPFERDTDPSKKSTVLAKTEEEIEAERADFYASLEKRNRERGITTESVAESISRSPHKGV